MTAKELLRKVRSRLDDAVQGAYSLALWTDEEILQDYANPTRDRLLLACPTLIIDSVTATDYANNPLCVIPVLQGVATYPLSTKVNQVVRLKLASQRGPLQRVSAGELDARFPGWEDAAPRSPWAFCTDLTSNTVTFIPAPDADDTARLTVHRFPLRPIMEADEDLAFPEEFQADLIPGILSLAFSKKDSGTDRPDLAALEETRFLKRLEEIKDILTRRAMTVHTIGVNRAFTSR